MSAIANDTAAVERRLWNEIENHQIGMLGVVGGAPHHLQTDDRSAYPRIAPRGGAAGVPVGESPPQQWLTVAADGWLAGWLYLT